MEKLTKAEIDDLSATLRERFENNMARHPDITWQEVEEKLESSRGKFLSLYLMESSGGEPDVIGRDVVSGDFLFCDCAVESPKGRRSLCYDRAALDARKAHKPQNCVLDVAKEMGVELLSEEQYRLLQQQLGGFDTKTSSWVKTPPEIREKGGAIFCDRRYGQVFTYHNGAESYYSSRGFRALIKV